MTASVTLPDDKPAGNCVGLIDERDATRAGAA
jgi:hypothetical protein